ncbi:hypothetical protein EDEG_04070 [Edhazardia aedis USNM 41457]|uniref:Uncharacterized protein n=1 Tax=Edhazardia aedis (strain USNM 41457) TaxID=1003232 RepID=J9DRZ7_EDHAE|nr:hypothetical protein EDEG_04070 [Edhazardia aedis USNM 41457]|eukprot:EJW05350.1 hypothetical protein EDEG_04070 [Edhazardia aedis USNM 41457]
MPKTKKVLTQLQIMHFSFFVVQCSKFTIMRFYFVYLEYFTLKKLGLGFRHFYKFVFLLVDVLYLICIYHFLIVLVLLAKKNTRNILYIYCLKIILKFSNVVFGLKIY